MIIAEERENLSRGGQSGRSEPEPDNTGQIQTSRCGTHLSRTSARGHPADMDVHQLRLGESRSQLEKVGSSGEVGLDLKTFQVLLYSQ